MPAERKHLNVAAGSRASLQTGISAFLHWRRRCHHCHAFIGQDDFGGGEVIASLSV